MPKRMTHCDVCGTTRGEKFYGAVENGDYLCWYCRKWWEIQVLNSLSKLLPLGRWKHGT